MKSNNNWFLILIISMTIGNLSPLQADANPLDDHGDTYKEATDLFFDSPQTGQIDSGEDVDYFRLEITEPGALTVYTTGTLDTIGSLEDDAGVFANGDQEGEGNNFSIVYDAKPETYWLRVGGHENATGDYTVHASFVPDLEVVPEVETLPDAPDDHGDTYKEATDLFFDSPQTGQIDAAEDVDYFRLEIPEPGALTVYTTGTLDTIGSIEDDTGIAFIEGDQEGEGDNFSIVCRAKPETYYIRVRGNENVTGDYTLHASFVPGEEQFSVQPEGIVADPENNTPDTAIDLLLGSARTQNISPAGDIDYFRIQINSSRYLGVHTTGSTDTVGRLENSGGATLVTSDDGGAGSNFSIVHYVAAGTYYIRVTGYSATTTGRYTIYAWSELDHTHATATKLSLNDSHSAPNWKEMMIAAWALISELSARCLRAPITSASEATVVGQWEVIPSTRVSRLLPLVITATRVRRRQLSP